MGMLTITIPKKKLWDSKEEVFKILKEQTLTLEHSLVSISKWESKWHIPFISDDKKTKLQFIDYIKCMTVTQNVDDFVYNALTEENFKEIASYIDNKMTATWFSENKNEQKPMRKEVITNELIYYWMIALEIPFECQKWHLNRLLTLIKVCNAKAKSANKKQNKNDIMSRNAELNAARRKKLGSSG